MCKHVHAYTHTHTRLDESFFVVCVNMLSGLKLLEMAERINDDFPFGLAMF